MLAPPPQALPALLAGGGLLGDHVITSDGALLLVACVDSVLAFATGTGEQAFRLQHAAPVTALCLHPSDGGRLLTATQDGQLTMWDLGTATAAQRWAVGSPVVSLVMGQAEETGERSGSDAVQEAGRRDAGSRAQQPSMLASRSLPHAPPARFHSLLSSPASQPT